MGPVATPVGPTDRTFAPTGEERPGHAGTGRPGARGPPWNRWRSCSATCAPPRSACPAGRRRGGWSCRGRMSWSGGTAVAGLASWPDSSPIRWP